jgi:hypothetical protein
MNNSPNNEYNRYVSVDAAPENSVCEWCKKTAKCRCLVTGGPLHNQAGLFCRLCGEVYACYVESVSKDSAARAEQMTMGLYDWMHKSVSDGTRSEQDMSCADRLLEGQEEEIHTWEDYLRWLGGTYAQ